MVPSVAPDNVTKEYRVAVVMYGGISLAIYMNGISQELLAMVRSTAAQDRNIPGSPMLPNPTGTDAVYRDLAAQLSEENDGDVHVRFVIDIVSGTSAGGINGVFLAKALTQRKDLTSLKRTWVEEGDFQKLLNDQTRSDISLPKQIPPRSLLSGERMYVKLLEAFADMDDADADPNTRKSYVEDLELSVTTTDLLGTVLPLKLADRLIWERKYKRVFLFRYREDEPSVDDFVRENTPFLAFAARCTSSFPAAFEPMQLASIPRLIKTSPKFATSKFWTDDQVQSLMNSKWQTYFGPADLRVPNAERFFADGGYLDNRPFDHAIDSLKRVSSSVRSERKLLYIEPSPEHPELDRSGENRKGNPLRPDALENLWAGLAGIPDQQPIRESLLQIQRRNLLIRKVTQVIGDISSAVELSELTDAQSTMATSDETQHARAVQTFRDTLKLPKYGAYRALKLYAVTDALAVRIAALLNFDPESDYVLAIRYLVKVWRISHYDHEDKEADFLLTFDIDYRLRRYQFVKSQLQMLSCLDETAVNRLHTLHIPTPVGPDRKAFRTEILALMGALDSSFRRVQRASVLAEKSAVFIQTISKLKITEEDLNRILGLDRKTSENSLAPIPVINQGGEEGRASNLLTPFRSDALNELQQNIGDHYRTEMSAARKSFTDAIAPSPGDTPMRSAVLRAASLYFNGFQEFDAAIFPITYGTDAGELVPVDVLRVSPEDAVAIQDESSTHRLKLAGSSFGAFGAFLEKAWRTNDILWGRLDGAERIIRALAGQGPAADALIARAHNTIIEEELTAANRTDLSSMLVEALLREGADGPLAQARGDTVREQIEACVRSAAGSTDINPKLKALLQSLLTTDQLRQALGNFEISREPNRKNTLESAARSARIFGRILDDIGRRRPFLKKPGALLIQAGSIMWGLVVVATPGSIWGSLSTYWFGLLTLFSVVMIVGGTVFSQPMQSLGIRLLVLSLAARLTISVLRSRIMGDHRWQRILEAAFVTALLVLLALGFIEAHNIWIKFVEPLTESLRQWVQSKL